MPAEMMIFYGFGLTSAALILDQVYGNCPAIAVDIHLGRAFKSLGWVHSLTTDPTEVAVQVHSFLP
jgi:endonuclease III